MIQCQFINHLLDTKDNSLVILNNVDNSYFSEYANEFTYLQNHCKKYGQIPDKETFLNRFPDFELIEVTESDKYLIDALFEDKRKRLLANNFNKISELYSQGKIDQAMDLYLNGVKDMGSTRSLDAVDITKDVSRYNDYVEKRNDFSKFYIKTGLKELDDILGGWDRREELVTVAARPGIGKSWIALYFAIAALNQGLNVGLYSGEMSITKEAYRFDTLLSHISNYGITRGEAEVEVSYKKFLEDLPSMYENHFWVITPEELGSSATVNMLEGFIDKYNLDILVVDQRSLMEDQRRASKRTDQAANISKDLKQLQVIKKIPLITVSQQNRESTDEKGVGTENIAESDRISQDSTIVIFLEQKDNIMKLILTKARDTQVGTKLSYAVDLNKGVFTFIPEENNGVNTDDDVAALRNEYESCGQNTFA